MDVYGRAVILITTILTVLSSVVYWAKKVKELLKSKHQSPTCALISSATTPRLLPFFNWATFKHERNNTNGTHTHH